MLRVCMVSDHGCIRVFKEANALLKRGIAVDVLANQAPFGYNKFTTAGIWLDIDQLKRSVQASPADIFHVHNEPDWMVTAVRDATNKPIIHDVHDLMSIGPEEATDDEIAAFEAADAIVHVSQPCADFAKLLHGNSKLSIVLPSYVNEEFIPDFYGDVSWNSIVYEGGLSSDGSVAKEENGKTWLNMRFWLPLVEEFTRQGWNVGLFCASSDPGSAYDEAGAFVVRNVHYPTLLRALRPYAFGIVGALRDFPLIQAALPNKLFEYISQGVVPVVFNADESARFVTEHGIGVVPQKGDKRSIIEQIVEAGQVARKRVIEMRNEFTMERQIQSLLDLYEEVVS